MITKIALDMLTETGVSVKTQKYVEDEGVEYAVGEPHRRAFVNSERGRHEIAFELAEPYLSAVMAVWGGFPTVDEMPVPDGE
jgi:hypothetical protein